MRLRIKPLLSPWINASAHFVLIVFLILATGPLEAQNQKANKAVPIFKDGLAQVVEEFSDQSQWIRHDLWVVTEFDSDLDGDLDRMHVSVTRPKQTETHGLK